MKLSGNYGKINILRPAVLICSPVTLTEISLMNGEQAIRFNALLMMQQRAFGEDDTHLIYLNGE